LPSLFPADQRGTISQYSDNEGVPVDHAVTMRSTYERINKADIAGVGDLVADDFVEHQGAGGPGFPPH
jgi:hypothetical protein